MKLSKTILILVFLAVSSFGISTAVLAQDKDDSDKATEAFDQAVLKTIDVNVISGEFDFNRLSGFDPNEALKDDDTALYNNIIADDSFLNNLEIVIKLQHEDSPQK
jgi:hypothetical protein